VRRSATALVSSAYHVTEDLEGKARNDGNHLEDFFQRSKQRRGIRGSHRHFQDTP
jgi:hypothetical protein